MKKIYSKPELEIIQLSNIDMICTSGDTFQIYSDEESFEQF